MERKLRLSAILRDVAALITGALVGGAAVIIVTSPAFREYLRPILIALSTAALLSLAAVVALRLYSRRLTHRWSVDRVQSLITDVTRYVLVPADREALRPRLALDGAEAVRTLLAVAAVGQSIAALLVLLGTLVAVATLATGYMQVDRLDRQNNLLTSQNALVETQNALAESARRSALVFELTAILDRVSDIAARSRPAGAIRPDPWDREQSTILPQYLIGRIAGVSRSLRPYRYLDDDGKLTKDLWSPERGQLLLSLYTSGVNLAPIVLAGADFSRAELSNVDLSGVHTFDETLDTRLQVASDAYVQELYLGRSFPTPQGVNLRHARLAATSLLLADLRKARLGFADLSGADLSHATLRDAELAGTVLDGANLSIVDLRGASGLTVSQVKRARNWRQAIFDEPFARQLGMSAADVQQNIKRHRVPPA